jgi:hypothetical protein
VQRAPGIPCSLFSRGTTFVQNFGRTRREIAKLCVYDNALFEN